MSLGLKFELYFYYFILSRCGSNLANTTHDKVDRNLDVGPSDISVVTIVWLTTVFCPLCSYNNNNRHHILPVPVLRLFVFRLSTFSSIVDQS